MRVGEGGLTEAYHYRYGSAMGDTLDLYHRTSPEAAGAIYAALAMTSKENTGEAYFSTMVDGQGTGYGTAVVHVRVPVELAEIDDEFPDGEEHYRVRVRDLKPEMFVTGVGSTHAL